MAALLIWLSGRSQLVGWVEQDCHQVDFGDHPPNSVAALGLLAGGPVVGENKVPELVAEVIGELEFDGAH